MPGRDPSHSGETLATIRAWVQKAENDLKTADLTLKAGRAAPTDTICFHAQQCVEKYLKALLVAQGIEFERIHHITALVALLPEVVRPDLTPDEQILLTDYAVSVRYPGEIESVSLDEARGAVAVARRVRSHVRQNLPIDSA